MTAVLAAFGTQIRWKSFPVLTCIMRYLPLGRVSDEQAQVSTMVSHGTFSEKPR